MKRYLLLIMMASIMIFSGCQTEKASEKLVEKNNQLEVDNEQLLNQIETLRVKTKKLQEENKRLDNNIELWKKLAKDKVAVINKLRDQMYPDKTPKDEFPWLATKNWDELTIVSEGERITVHNQDILQVISRLFSPMHEVQMPPNGFQSGIPRYTYILKNGEKEYKVEVVGRGVIAIGERYFEVNPYVHHLGKAFGAPPLYVKNLPITTKLVYSGMLEGEINYKLVSFSPFRIKGTIVPLLKAQRIKETPKQPGNLYEIFTFYYYGEKIEVKVYDKHVQIDDGKNQYWYEMDDATEIGRIFLAG